jgi:hypothetical protein
LTFRTGKRHKVQESGKTGKSVQKLATRLQRFANTGKASKRDLVDIDCQLRNALFEHAKKITRLLDQLSDHASQEKAADLILRVRSQWSDWLSDLESRDSLGYSDVKFEKQAGQNAILDSIMDADSELFNMLSAFNSALVSNVERSSYQIPDFDQVYSGAIEIIETYQSKQRMLSRLAH